MEGFVAALARRCSRAKRETLPAVAPSYFVVALDELSDAICSQCTTAFDLPSIILRPPTLLPKLVDRQSGIEPNWVRDNGQDLLECWGDRDEDALEEVVALSISLWIIPDAAINTNAS